MITFTKPFAVEWVQTINRLNKNVRLRTTSGHEFCNDEQELLVLIHKLKEQESVIEIKTYERINEEYKLIDTWNTR